LPKTPQNRPISECTICPPMSGSESTSEALPQTIEVGGSAGAGVSGGSSWQP
jgi:hypothetical protein